MKFINDSYNLNRFKDNVFSLSELAKKDESPETVNATAGCLFHENGKIASFQSVFLPYRGLEGKDYTSYSSSPAGNPDFLEVMDEFVLEGKISLPHYSIATPGGTGAIWLPISMCLKEGETLIIPEISWVSYRIMAEDMNLNVKTYDVYDLDTLFKAMDETEGKVFVIINSPCENPLGHRYTVDEHKAIIYKANSLNKEVILLYDTAYLDYADNGKDFFYLLNDLNDNVLALIAYSCSKSFSYYGMRLGVLTLINRDDELTEHIHNLFLKKVRSTWSNVNNSGMINITRVLKNARSAYLSERQVFTDLLKERASVFKKEADEAGLEYYPYSDGFFITVKTEDDMKDDLHQRLMDNHIYAVKVNKGIRIAICSIPLNKLKGLAKRIKELY